MASEKEDEQLYSWTALIYLSCLTGLFIPFLNIIAPALLWRQHKGESSFLDQNAKNILNFQISITLACLVLIALGALFKNLGALFAIFYVSCFLLVSLLILFNLAAMIIGSIQARKGEQYHFPLLVRIIK